MRDTLYAAAGPAKPPAWCNWRGAFRFKTDPPSPPPCLQAIFLLALALRRRRFFSGRRRSCALLLLLLLAAASASAWPARERTKSATRCWQEGIKTSHALKEAPASTSWLVVGFVL
jgi:hypothetical protein